MKKKLNFRVSMVQKKAIKLQLITKFDYLLLLGMQQKNQ